MEKPPKTFQELMCNLGFVEKKKVTMTDRSMGMVYLSLSIQICPKKGITPIFLFWGWD